MRTREETRHERRLVLPERRKRPPIGCLGVFGSRIRGDRREDGDRDLLVGLDAPVGLPHLAALTDELEDATGLDVDLAQRPLLHARLRPRIMAEAEPI